MTKFIFSRLLYICLALFVVMSLMFFLSRLTGDPASLMLPTNATQDQIETLRARLGLDKSMVEQYLIFLRRVITERDFGTSYRYNEPAFSLVLRRAFPTARLAAAALGVAIFIGIPTGVISGLRPGSLIDLFSQTFALIGQSMPTFWLGIMLIRIFAVNLGWFPVMGGDRLIGLVLPAITLGLPTAALISRMLRSSVLDVKREDYIITARSKGLTERVITFKHVLRNALIPVTTIIMLQMGFLMGGAVVTENVFNYPGIGLLAVQSIYGRDFVVVQSFVVFAAFLIMLLNFFADFFYVVIDPRVKFGE